MITDDNIKIDDKQNNDISLIFASISNYLDNDKDKDIERTEHFINLDPVKIMNRDFKYLFYNSVSDNFHISISKSNIQFLQFNKFTLDSKPFSLMESILNLYKEYNKTEISIHKKILIQKNINKLDSILNIQPYLFSLNYNEIMSQLKNSYDFNKNSNMESNMDNNLVLSVKIHESVSNIFLNLNIPFNIVGDNIVKPKTNLNNQMISLIYLLFIFSV